jgi:anaerobic selenocysteine-containing dehydrogenase
VLAGERLTCTLADEILTPGHGQIRALFNEGGNPATMIPDRPKVERALQSLDLLVSIEPFMTDTARLSHYIFAPRMQYERSDVPIAFVGVNFNSAPFAQFTPAVAAPPPRSELVDDSYVYWSLAKRLGLPLTYMGVPLGMEAPPTMDALLALRCKGSWVALEEIQAHPSGKIYDLGLQVQPAAVGAGRFHAIPDDVATDLARLAVRADQRGGQFPFRLLARRDRDFCNSLGTLHPGVRKRNPENLVFAHPDDLRAEGLADGDEVEIVSGHGRIPAHVAADDSLRQGTVSMTHGFGEAAAALSGDATRCANINDLVSSEQDIEPINAMARMSAIPIRLERRRGSGMAPLPH